MQPCALCARGPFEITLLNLSKKSVIEQERNAKVCCSRTRAVQAYLPPLQPAWLACLGWFAAIYHGGGLCKFVRDDAAPCDSPYARLPLCPD